jgi:hypothetical protein
MIRMTNTSLWEFSNVNDYNKFLEWANKSNLKVTRNGRYDDMWFVEVKMSETIEGENFGENLFK